MRFRLISVAAAGTLALAMLSGIRAHSAPEPRQSPAAAKPEPWKPEDIVLYESAGQLRITPDGTRAVWVKNFADKEKDARASNLYLTSLVEKREVQLTRGSYVNTQPRWSPDGSLIAFLSTRPLPKEPAGTGPAEKPAASPATADEEARSQIWLLSAHGGEPWPLTESKRGVQRSEWLDAETILFSAEEEPTFYEQELQRKRDDARVVEDEPHTPPVRLFKIAVKDKKITRLTENRDWIGIWAAAPDGRHVVAVHARSLRYDYDQKIPPVVFLYDLATGEREQLFTDGKIRPLLLRWGADSSGFYVTAPYSSDPFFQQAYIIRVHYYEVASRKVTEVPLNWENGLSSDVALLEITPDGFIALLADGVRYKPARYTRREGTWTQAFLEGEHIRNIFDLSVSNDAGTVVYEYSTASRPPQWHRAQMEGARLSHTTQVTELNPHLKNKTFARTEAIRWKGALDEEVEGILYYPHGYEAGKKYPLIVAPHGGPASADLDAWDDRYSYPHNLLNQRGAVILKPNYHGSANYGLKWVESICCGKYYDLEIPDLEAGVDALIARGMVDAERIGAMGWSNGSILTIQLLVANPSRYKAASAGAGSLEYFSDWGTSNIGNSFDPYYFGKRPFEDPELMRRKSPFLQLDRVRTPTLIIFGGEDPIVHPSQGWMHFRALQHFEKAPVRFVLLPGEPHTPRKPSHQLRKVEEDLAWFDRYLFKAEQTGNEALKRDSPLGRALLARSIARSGTLYGVAFSPKGKAPGPPVPIPEVVRRDALEIGRFEVTRAQFAAFDRNYRFDGGTENFPANGISLENARGYVEWLARLTGAPWRIPNEAEVASLYERREGENTLDYWAGYALNPDDAARLREKVKELAGAAPLLKEAGSFPGAGEEGEELLFDLGGNVTEWVLKADGTGRALGGSADRPADPKTADRAASAAYIGFRVVRGAPKPEKK